MTALILEGIGRCDPTEALTDRNSHYWHDFDLVRGISLRDRVGRLLDAAEPERKHNHIVVAGPHGSGTTTELHRIIYQAQDKGFLPFYAAVNERINSSEISFGDIFLLLLRLLDDKFNSSKRKDPKLKPLPAQAIKEVTDWFRDVTRVEEREVERAISYSSETGLGLDTPIARLLFGLSVLRKATGKQREEIKSPIERYPDQLLQKLNLLLEDATKIAASEYPKGLIFILDNLDRYPVQIISQTVLNNAGLFKGVKAHIIFVLSISLAYNPDLSPHESVDNLYEFVVLPMIPVFQRDDPDTRNDVALASLVEAIFKRVDRSLFANPALPRELARLSGGCPRDLMRLLREALLESKDRVDERAVKHAAGRLRGLRARNLTRAHYAALARIYLEGSIDPDETGRFLLQRRAALEYNSERWVGVHPVLWDTLEFKAALEKEKRKRGMPLKA